MKYQHKTNGAIIEVLEVREKYNTALVRDEDGRETELSTSTLKRYWNLVEDESESKDVEEPETKKTNSKKKSTKAEKPKREKVDYDQLMSDFAKKFESEYTSVKSYGCSRKIFVKFANYNRMFAKIFYRNKDNILCAHILEEVRSFIPETYESKPEYYKNGSFSDIVTLDVESVSEFGGFLIKYAKECAPVTRAKKSKKKDNEFVDTTAVSTEAKVAKSTTNTKKLQVKKTVIKKGGKK